MAYTHPITRLTVPEYMVGVIAPMFTPANQDGSINYTALKEYADYLVDHLFVSALFCRSGVGRMYTYSMDEAKRSFEITLQSAGDKKPVFCGTSGEFDGNFEKKVDPDRYIEQTLELSHFAEEAGATALVLVIPAGIKVSSDSTVHETVVHFFKTIHDNTSIPIVIYNPQNLPKEYHSTPQLIKELGRLERIVGLKLSTNDMYWMSDMIAAAPKNNFYIIAGSECIWYQAFLTGATGVIGQGCSIYPNLLSNISINIATSDFEFARQLQMEVNQALKGFQNLPPDISGFAYLRRKGLNMPPYCRDKSPPLPESTVDKIFKSIESYCHK